MSDEISPEEAELAARISKADGDALAKFLDLKRPQVMAFIGRRLGTALKSKVESEDIFQETSIEAVRTLSPEWPGDKEPFSWLCRIAERKIIDAHRHHFDAQKRSAGKEASLDRKVGGGEDGAGLVNLLVKSMTTPSAAFSKNAKEARMFEAIQGLKEDQQIAIRMKYLENRPSKEIADRLGKSDAAIRVLLSRTMKQLQELLGED